MTGHPSSEYGWAVQGGVKINTPFIAPGDTLYLQGAYGEGSTLYTGYSSYNGSYTAIASTINGAAFDPFMSDATLNPLTGKIETSTSFTVVGSFLHYWSPEWRSAVFGSYGRALLRPWRSRRQCRCFPDEWCHHSVHWHSRHSLVRREPGSP